MTDTQILGAEERWQFRFPPDLRDFLLQVQPQGRGWIKWVSDADEEIQERLDRPAEGLAFDVVHNGLWMDQWGPKPANLSEAVDTVRKLVAGAPRLIPIFHHRYLPAEPCLAGNPVFSVYQSDIIHYGYDLAGYFANEFRVDPAKLPDWYLAAPSWVAAQPRPIRFWDDFL